MTELLDSVIEAHGGLERWEQVAAIRWDMAIGGGFWAAKGWPDLLAHETFTTRAHEQHTTIAPFGDSNRRAVWNGDLDTIRIESAEGELIESRDQPRRSFDGYTRGTQWDAGEMGYFLGYAFWNYLTSPFTLTRPGIRTEELPPWREAGQTWRRLLVEFPLEFDEHNPLQIFYYDSDLMQRRHDYITEIVGSTLVAQYQSRHVEVDGLIFPSRRRVLRRNPDDSSNHNLIAMTFDLDNFVIENRTMADSKEN
jgi:hypothetical protein